MKNTWLVSSLVYSPAIYDLLAYYDYLIKCNFLFISYTNLSLLNLFSSCFYVTRYFIREMNLKMNYATDKSRITNKFLRLKTKTFLNKKRKLPHINFIFKHFNNKIKPNFTVTGESSYFFNAFFLMNQISLNQQQSLHHNFYLFGVSKTRNKTILMEPKKFFKK